MLKKLGEGLHYGEDDVRFFGASIQTRMSVVTLPGGGVLVISPLILTRQMKSELDALGPVQHVASPNKIHNQGLASFAEAYPKALIWASPGMVERRSDIRFAGTLDDHPHPDWAPVLDQLVTKGNLFFSEAVFFHASSKTLIVADLVENICNQTVKSKHFQRIAKFFGVFGRPLPSPEFRAYTSDGEAAGERLDKISMWDFERILMAHGTMITENAHEILRDVRNFLIAEVKARSPRRAALYKFLASLQ